MSKIKSSHRSRAHVRYGYTFKSKCQQVFSLATQRPQQGISYVYTQNKKLLPLVVVNHLHLNPVPPLLCSPASFPSLFLHLHPLFLLFCSSSLSASSASPWTTRSTYAFSWLTCPETWTGKVWSGQWRSPAVWRVRSRFIRLSTGSCLTWTWSKATFAKKKLFKHPVSSNMDVFWYFFRFSWMMISAKTKHQRCYY